MLISQLGYIVHPSHPHLGASPDGLLASPDGLLASPDGLLASPDGLLASPDGLLASHDGLLMCDCCGLGVLEIKCPYILSKMHAFIKRLRCVMIHHHVNVSSLLLSRPVTNRDIQSFIL